VKFVILRMTQSHLESIAYELVKEDAIVKTECDSDLCNEETVAVKQEDEEKQEETKKNPDKNKFLIRKVEMNLDSETDIHIYETKLKFIVKKQIPFYITKKTWKLLLSKSETINTASKLTEL
jgi:hypothetical protein